MHQQDIIQNIKRKIALLTYIIDVKETESEISFNQRVTKYDLLGSLRLQQLRILVKHPGLQLPSGITWDFTPAHLHYPSGGTTCGLLISPYMIL